MGGNWGRNRYEGDAQAAARVLFIVCVANADATAKIATDDLWPPCDSSPHDVFMGSPSCQPSYPKLTQVHSLLRERCQAPMAPPLRCTPSTRPGTAPQAPS